MEYDFGLLLKQLRNKKGWTQKQLADKTGVSRASIANYEHNTAEPPKEFIISAALAFGVSTDYLLNVKQQGVLHIGDLPIEIQKSFEDMASAIRRNRK